ncbi:uncharacterized protein LOC130054910 [Ostrea edulis]|uniref:uncharacterized protein LOC130054910 n=1 Tax=Ostrea edulis TaxID=37623 RepID=UPI0024AF60FF|nr:uncharacterized protein LOC130054910 [Ostrea edulis]
MTRRKTRLHRQTRKTGKWENYRHFQRECKKAFRRAEWSYVNNTIQKGLTNNNTKPFWSYVKSKQQDNVGVSPLKRKGQLFRDSYSCETQLAVTIEDLTSSYDRGIQTDIAIFDFSKAFDTVPHHKLLHKLKAYGIQGRLHQGIQSFLCNRLMRVVVEGECSKEVTVDSGVPPGYCSRPPPIPLSYK